MTFLAPGWIALAAAASAAVVVIHMIAWQLPRAVPLPTARFVPDEPARRAARTVRLSDLALLALRVAILMVGGLAMARPTFRVAPSGSARVIVIERSGSMGDAAVLRDSVRALPRADRTVFVVFDTTAVVEPEDALALSAASDSARGHSASLTVGLLAAIREARRLTRDYESVEMVLVSTLSQHLFDAATAGVRRTWPDSIRAVRIQPAQVTEGAARVELNATDDDPVAAGIQLARSHGMLSGTSRVVRKVATAADSMWAASGAARVVWPRADRTAVDRVSGLHTSEVTVAGHFIPTSAGDSGQIMVRWLDGSAAARESAHGSGCIRTVGFDVPDVGDLVLTPSFQRLVSVLLAPCGGRRSFSVAADSVIAGIIALPSGSVAPTLADDVSLPNRLAAALVALALLLATAELLLRRRTGGGMALLGKAS